MLFQLIKYMKKIGMIGSSLVLSLGLVGMASASHDSDQYSYAAAVTEVERAGAKAIPTNVTWVESVSAEDGTLILDHFEVILLENSTEVGRASATADVRTITLNKGNIPDMKSFKDYFVRVDEFYTDDTSSEGVTAYLYTAPPKLKDVKVKNKDLDGDGRLSLTVKWDQPTSLRNNNVYYDYKITNKGNASKLVEEGYDWGDIYKINIDDLPAKTMQIKVRARTDDNGNGQWSKWVEFHSPTE